MGDSAEDESLPQDEGFRLDKDAASAKKMLGESQRSKGRALIGKGEIAGKAAIQDSPTPR
ncbi:MAG: hypothetical protein WAK69_05495 [Rhodoplanes sp.]